ncbi:hypothetical protein A3K78_08855 [Candidatus Bathyarchaeota archaeon RBG_13_52_12]|nr:MAG: hypothetical protein A3K78_08855 [Candidatus Bathyarchaeota archaeon RBG_13_52_12]
MAILIANRIFGLVCLLAIMLAVAYFIRRAQGGKVPKVRRIPGIDAMDEAIGRAVEMGRSVICSHGIANLRDSTTGPQTIAGLSVLSYVAKKCAEVSVRLIVPVRMPEVWPIAVDVVETAYKMVGKGDEFKESDIVYLSSEQFGYSSNYMGLLMREKPGANIMVGAYWAESMQLAETGSRVGAMQIAGTAQTSQIPFFLVSTDYCLIGEEIYAAGAYLTNEAPLIASLAGQDFGRIIAVILGILGALLTTVMTAAGNPLLTVMSW